MSSYKVKLVGGGGMVRFEASSPVSESRSANYEGYNIVHLPTSLWAYRNTNGRHFSISGKLVSRTPGEAAANAGNLSTIRSWVLPGFGATGSTPPIVFLTAYNNRNVFNVPCVVLSYSWTFPDDVDYIFNVGEPMPVIGMVGIELEEAYSAQQITAGAWYIPPGGGGAYSYTSGVTGASGGGGGAGGGGSGSGSGFGNVATDVLGTVVAGFAGIAANPNIGFPTLGGLLNLNPYAISQIPSMAGTLAANLTNSPLIGEATAQIVGLSANPFVSGSSVQQVLNNSIPNFPPPASLPTMVSDAFGRSTDVGPPPTFFEPGS